MRAIVYEAEGSIAGAIRETLHARSWDVLTAEGEEELFALIRDTAPDLLAMEGRSGESAALALARRIRNIDHNLPLLMIIATCDAALVLGAMRAGVTDVLFDSSSSAEIAAAIERVVAATPEAKPVRPLIAGERLVGRSRASEQLRQAIQRVAGCDSSVLITGETGTGKELAAELIHCNSRRRNRPFVSINCAAIPDGLLESELFGCERGAFTGAHASREGKLQHAHGGTLFLDEIGEMSLYAQAKILRAIESRKVQRLGGNREIAVDVRLIVATNQNLEQLTSQHKFRQDLYFRINVARIHLPPLREHAEDIPELVAHLMRELAARMERRVDEVDASFLDALRLYGWPGNVRELRNLVESTLVFAGSSRITRRDLPPYLRALFASEERKRESDREKIVGALRATDWNRNEAARLLGCSRMTLYRKMVRYRLFAAESGDGAENASVLA